MKGKNNQGIQMRKVSLQLHSQYPSTYILRQNRANLSYSTNYKKRVDALFAQRVGLQQCYKKPDPNVDLKGSSQKKEKIGVFKGRISTGSRIKGNNNKDLKQMQKIESNFQITAQCINIREKKDIGKKCEKYKERSIDYSSLNKKTQKYEITYDQNSHQEKALEFNKSVNSCWVKEIKTECAEKDQFCSENFVRFDLNTKQSESEQRNNSLDNHFIHSIDRFDKIQTLQNIKERTVHSNRVFSISSEKSPQKNRQSASKASTKQIYKTSNINLSQHFNNFHKRADNEKAKKLTVSNINKCYQLCIQQTKTWKKNISQEPETFFNHRIKTYNDEIWNNSSQTQGNFSIMRNNSNPEDDIKFKRSVEISRKNSSKYDKNEKILVRNGKVYSAVERANEKNNDSKMALKAHRAQVEENIWFQIKNSLENQENSPFAVCSKKKLMQRGSFDLMKKQMIKGRTIITKFNTNEHEYQEDHLRDYLQIRRPVTAIKVNKLKEKREVKNVSINDNKRQEGRIVGWEVQLTGGNFSRNFSNQDQQINF